MPMSQLQIPMGQFQIIDRNFLGAKNYSLYYLRISMQAKVIIYVVNHIQDGDVNRYLSVKKVYD